MLANTTKIGTLIFLDDVMVGICQIRFDDINKE